ncbi:uncharacterized protein LOC110176294 [Drosophila serrata]|uniref:uncharacterized protein LOC110176294 n=1 Tax=Drosophila serrata TaxID=7274 RepID=UPI000A1CFC83|nr:uncharacterized protein LOC110176294 [Drosophila serrata]
MKAIRCKSSRQVSSQVMIPFGFLIIFLLAGTSFSVEKYRSNYDKKLNAYEYCIKLIAACEKLRDKVENFTESDEFKINQDTVKAALNKYKKFGCLPKGLSPAGLRSYGNLVAKWENQVHELFLLQNLFSVVEEHKDGLQIKVTFGQMQGWCPMSDDPQEITSRTTSTTSTKESLKQSSTFKPELVSTTKKNNKLLGNYRNQSCCSYKSIRDRVEIINDGIDILEDLQDLKPSEKKVYSDIESDYRNLNTRLDHLKNGNYTYSSGKCCPAFVNQFKSFQTKENLWKSNKTLSDTENLIDLEAKEIEKLKKQSENISQIQENKTLINSLSLNISKLVIKLNDMESIRTMDLSKLNTNSFKKVFEKYRKHHNDLNKSIKAIEASPQGSLTNDDEVINPDINKLEKDLVNLTDNSIPKLALEIKYRRKDIADKLERKEQQDITWFNEEIKKKKLQILERLDKLNQKKVDSEKVRQLEAYILQLSDRHRSLAQRIEDRHEVLKQNANELSKGIAAASSNALSCHHNCNLANFPTMDALAKREN